ncbi:hypothetical protein SDC9_125495 [bioreactor metagenome]|uniref:Uncharacterized protein n=1 Tax=bioreactor metagenome TaxID=1076179 RepID=A0A645CNM9_9ZZZZ
MVQINGELTCSVSSGPIVQSATKAAAAGDVGAAALLSTPYQRMREQSASPAQCESRQSAAAGDGLESINHVGIGDILWNCTNTKYAGCTGRFGRGIRICMSEWLVHNQVGDYWNIRWYNNAWKASTQSVIKAGGYVIRAAISYYLGGRAWSGAVLELLDYAGGVIDSVSNTKIAGHSITGLKSAGAVILEFQKNFKNLGKDLKQAGIGFAFDMAVDMAAQMVQVQVTGWQDYSDGSHKACDFRFK